MVNILSIDAMGPGATVKTPRSIFTFVYGKGGGVKPPQTTILAAISEPLGIKGCALATFPEYELATRSCLQTIFGTFHKSNMAAGKPEILSSQCKYKLTVYVLQL